MRSVSSFGGSAGVQRLLCAVLLLASIGCGHLATASPPRPEDSRVVELSPLTEGVSSWRRGASSDIATVVETAAGEASVAFDIPTDVRRAILYRMVDVEVARPFELELEVTVDGFDEVSYLAFGWLGEEGFWHDRIRHLRQGEPLRLELDPGSLAFGLANAWRRPLDWSPRALRVVVSGVPGPGARVEVGSARLRVLSTPLAQWSDRHVASQPRGSLFLR